MTTNMTTNWIGRPGRSPLIAAVVVVALLVGASALIYGFVSAPAASTVPYSRFLADVGAGSVTRVVQTGTTLDVSGPHGGYQVMVPTVLTDVFADVEHAAAAGDAAAPTFEAQPAPDSSWIGLLLTALLPFAVILATFVLVLLLVVRPARRDHARSLNDRLRELDDALRSGLITDDERERQRARILDEA